MCLTSAFALFKLKLFDIHDLSGNRNTDAYSLCVNAALFNRMQFALVRCVLRLSTPRARLSTSPRRSRVA